MHVNPRIASLLAALNNPSLPGIDLSLERMWQLLAALGNPQDQLPPVIHVAGTNGKGSTIAYLRAIYAAAGYRAHAYTSPHLVRFNERIVIAGQEITDDALLPLLECVARAAQNIPVTFFEATTAAAFLAFAETEADIVLLETGLGGRLDATNVIAAPAMTVITPIDYDHTEFLGTTIAAIAAEKAGIVKAGVPCVIGAQQPEAYTVIAHTAAALDAPLIADWRMERTATGITVHQGDEHWSLPHPALLGDHQYHNAALASVVAKNCRASAVSDRALNAGIAAAHWPGRLQKLAYGPLVEAWGLRGDVYLDGGHNASGANALAAWIAHEGKSVTLLCGMMQRKDAGTFLAPFAAHVRHVLTVPIGGEACYAPDALAVSARTAGVASVTACETISAAELALVGDAPGTLLITGSLFLAGELLKNHG